VPPSAPLQESVY